MIRPTALLLAATAALALAACGNKRELKPAPGYGLPPAPYGREASRGGDALLRAPIQAKPDRNVELRSRSQEREDDPFDLPPED
ncbi:hypothetical protein [Novosphingobium sp.]|uniref:hypothetical protein n=1 Tax=Novosphingobium sp. TaxID=1874826 RepID=UPI002FDEE58C